LFCIRTMIIRIQTQKLEIQSYHMSDLLAATRTVIQVYGTMGTHLRVTTWEETAEAVLPMETNVTFPPFAWIPFGVLMTQRGANGASINDAGLGWGRIDSMRFLNSTRLLHISLHSLHLPIHGLSVSMHALLISTDCFDGLVVFELVSITADAKRLSRWPNEDLSCGLLCFHRTFFAWWKTNCCGQNATCLLNTRVAMKNMEWNAKRENKWNGMTRISKC
jgi:hypothetical protein